MKYNIYQQFDHNDNEEYYIMKNELGEIIGTGNTVIGLKTILNNYLNRDKPIKTEELIETIEIN